MRIVLVIAVLLASGCERDMLVGRLDGGSGGGGGGGGGGGVAGYSKSTAHQGFLESVNHKLDLLFMIDNSNSMEPKQASLQQYFPNFIQPLKDLPSGIDLHIGIVTSDMGAGQFTPPSCDTIGGCQGILQNTALGTTCTAAHLINAADRFLTYAPDASGGVQANFVGDIADAFACYAAVGTGGCGFEHQLASVKAALDGCESDAGCKQRQNVGFFRDDAYLAIIILTDEDDCSAPSNSTLFDPTQTTLNSALGPLTSYRCFEFGNLCGGADPGRSQGQRYDCEPGNKDANPAHQLIATQDIAAFIKALKPQDPRMAYVSVIAGPPDPIAVGLDANGYPDLQPSCTGGMGSADPATRLARFAREFGSRGTFTSVCDVDLSGPLADIGVRLSQVVGRHCLNALPADTDPATPTLDPACEVEAWTTIDAAAGTYSFMVVPRCPEVLCDPATAPGGDCACAVHPQTESVISTTPCWYLWANSSQCAPPESVFPVGYELKVDWGTNAACQRPDPPSGTELRVTCAACVAKPASNKYDCSPGCAAYWPRCCPTPSPGCAQ